MIRGVQWMKHKVNMVLGGIRLLIICLFIISSMSSFASSDSKIKQPNVSGQFYEADPKLLSANIDTYFSQSSVSPSDKHVDILIAPHAGYMYSGGVAAYGFKLASHQQYNTIVILAPSHYVSFDGISIWKEGGFQTPLGIVDVDNDFTAKLIRANDKFYFTPEAFDREHSLEVEIPFLQKTFSDFKIVPVIMGQPSFKLLNEFAATLKETIGDRKDVLVVVSTDLSHYHDDVFARKMDQKTIEAVKDLKAEQVFKECQLRTMEMCGCMPVTAALLYAKLKGLDGGEILRYANSGDVSGDTDRVVGYTSIVFYGKNGKANESPDSSLFTLGQKKQLIDIARNTINEYIRTGKKIDVKVSDERLMREEGAFVTIHKNGNLRGCIGNIIGRKPLYQTVHDMAISSSTQDPRFPPVTVDELDDIDVEVSVLSVPKVISNVDEIQLGVHGVIVSQGPSHSGVFLPQVADETQWTKEEFLSHLCSQKANLPADAWKDPKTKIEIFTAEVFSESDVQ